MSLIAQTPGENTQLKLADLQLDSERLRALESLGSETRNLSLGVLHLGKAIKPLDSAGIRSIGGLVDQVGEGLPKLWSFGRVAHREVVESLVALAHSITPTGAPDWIAFARARQFAIIPTSETSSWSAQDLLSSLSQISREVIPRQLTDREWVIFKQRLLAVPKRRPTLQQLGDAYHITRERIRQLQELALDVLRKPLLLDDYAGLTFRFRPEIGLPLREAAVHFDSVGLPAWLRDRWIEELARIWHVSVDEIRPHYTLLGELLSYEQVQPDNGGLEPFLVHKATPKKQVERLRMAVDAIHEVLSDEVLGYEGFEVVRAVNERLPSTRFISVDELPSLIELCSSSEAKGEGLYRTKFEDIRGRANQVVRLLSDRGQPMHFRHLLREVNKVAAMQRKPAVGKGSLVNQLTADERIQPIGRTGEWTLAEWGSETRSIIEVMVEALHASGEAMTQTELWDAVRTVRPAAENSIPLLLGNNPDRFRRVAPRVWALVEWGDRSDTQWWDKDEIGKFIDRFFDELGKSRTDFSNVRQAFIKASGLSDHSARGILARHPAILVERPDAHARLAVFQRDWKTRPAVSQPPRSRRPGVMDKISDALRAKLLRSPTKERPLIDLVKELEAELGVIRPTVYAVVSQSEEFEAVSVEDSAFKICRFIGETRPEFPRLSDLQTSDWRTECARGITHLNVENVDIGLFIFGRQFDSAMQTLLLAAQQHGSPPVAEHDLNKLYHRIEWALRNGVFTDKANADLLRIQRNERGHKPPSEEERRATMKFAAYLAELYLDYLIIVERKIEEWRRA